ncbi:hypothetical protein [Kitasatospora azatica]|uniref:hypothetical protein n=1 Tax=Kitasatospora azatica TaxID=58347 RepID=UPI000569A7C1|nr:hypothetical protein [Kitasatospora azatica]
MAPSDHPHGSAEWYVAYLAEVRAQEMIDRQAGHQVLVVTDYGFGTRTESVENRPGLSSEQSDQFQALRWSAWHARVDYGLEHGEFTLPAATAWERALYGTATSPFNSRAPLHAAAVWLSAAVIGLVTWGIANQAVAIFATLVTVLLAAVVLRKQRLTGLATLALATSAGYVFGPHRLVVHPGSHLGGFVEISAADYRSHWIGACLFLALALTVLCLGALVVDKRRMLPPRRTAKWVTVTVVSALLSALALFVVGPLAVLVFLVSWPVLYGLATAGTIAAVGLFESVTARPPVVAREKAYLYRLRHTIDYQAQA